MSSYVEMLMQVAALLLSQVSSFSVGVGGAHARYKAKPLREPAPAGDLPAGNGLAIQVTVYSPLGSTSLSPLVSYSTNSYSPARAPVRPRPRATRSQGQPRRPPSTHQFRNFAGHGQHVFAAIKLKTHDPSTLFGCIPASQCTWYAPQS